MARVFTSGFEFNSVLGNFEWSANSNTPSVTTTAARSGVYGLRIVTLSSGAAKGLRVNVNAAGSTTGVFWARIALRIITLPGSNGSTVLAFCARGGFTTPFVYARLLSTGAIELFDEDGSIGTSSTTLSVDGNFHLIEIRYNASGGAGADIAELRIDESVEVTSSTRTLDTSGASLVVGGNIALEANTTGEWYIDDVACNDNSGSVQNSYPGDGKVVVLRPTGDGDTTNRGAQGTDWETGPSASGTGWQMVDDPDTPDDATTYIALMTTSTGPTDPPVFLVTVESLTSKGVDSNDLINVVAVRARWGQTDGIGRNAVSLMKSGSTFSESATISFSGTSWVWDDASLGYGPYSVRVNYVDPNTGSAWTLSAVDALQVGVRAHSDVTPNPWCTMICAEVEYLPQAAAAVNDARIVIRKA